MNPGATTSLDVAVLAALIQATQLNDLSIL
jgi:hypothetical protein